MSHDYDPLWDYPVIEIAEVDGLSTAEAADIMGVVARLRRDLAPTLGFAGEAAFEVFFVEEGGLHDGESVAVYVSGTSSRPMVGVDLHLTKALSQGEWLKEFELSLAHELAHAYQESTGQDQQEECGLDEDAAEQFARNWVERGVVDLWRLDKHAPPPRVRQVGCAS